MKKLVATGLIGILVISIAAPIVTYAQGAGTKAPPPSTVVDSSGNTTSSGNSGGSAVGTAVGAGVGAAVGNALLPGVGGVVGGTIGASVGGGSYAPSAAVAAGTQAAVDTVESAGSVVECFGDIVKCFFTISKWFALLSIQVALFFLALTGGLLDLALQYLAFDMSKWIGSGSSIGEAIAYGWAVFRDLGNLLLIAGLIWASIAMILQADAGGQKPGALVVKLIIAALLINFSYFFAGAMIDASNVLSKTIYEQGIKGLEQKISLGEGVGTVIGKAAGNAGLAEEAQTYMEKISLFGVKPFAGIFLQETRLLSVLDSDFLEHEAKQGGLYLIYASFTFLLLLGAIYIFTAIAFLIIGRFVIFLILLISAPVMILKFIKLPWLSQWGDQWWKEMVNQGLFLPVFLIFSMISFRVIAAFSTGATPFVETHTFVGFFAPDGDVLEGIKMVLMFGMSLGMLHASYYAAKSIATGASLGVPDFSKMVQGKLSGVGAGAGKLVTGKFAAGAPKWASSMLMWKMPLWTAGKGLEIGGGVANRIGGGLYRMGPKQAVDAAKKGGKEVRASIPFGLGGISRKDLEREAAGKARVKKEVDVLTKDLHNLEALAAQQQAIADDETKPLADRTAATQSAIKLREDAHKVEERLKHAYPELYNKVGAEDFAKQIKDLDPEAQDAAISTLPEEDQEKVREELRRLPKAKPSSTGAPGTGGGTHSTLAGNDGGIRKGEIDRMVRAIEQNGLSEGRLTRSVIDQLRGLNRKESVEVTRQYQTLKEIRTVAHAMGKERFGQVMEDRPEWKTDQAIQEIAAELDSRPNGRFAQE